MASGKIEGFISRGLMQSAPFFIGAGSAAFHPTLRNPGEGWGTRGTRQSVALDAERDLQYPSDKLR